MEGDRQILICRADAASKSLPQAAKLPVQGKVDFGENACVFAERRMRSFSWEEARKPSLPRGDRPHPTRFAAHLPLNRSLRSLGKAVALPAFLLPCYLPDQSVFLSYPTTKIRRGLNAPTVGYYRAFFFFRPMTMAITRAKMPTAPQIHTQAGMVSPVPNMPYSGVP